ncbi:hypothetical protein BS47DRAFT_1339166 [Hydnum rufescens UP504]|uniref:Uncharacterized protein n=1 Tax=Hydnum rufescens UP504 TaxID=1448309 RepID=A0A9P6B4M8_9AGAM|nr:hypothetical protein BS47DRAFT_1339166 [Hydnum rufescens UP504]
MAAATDRKHAHTSLALMELLYITVVLVACSPITPHEFGSSIGLIGAVANLAFAIAIAIAGDIRWGDFISLFKGDDGIRKVDGKRADD